MVARPSLRLRIEPMRMEDLPAVHAIEAASFDAPWPPEAYQHDLETNRLAQYHVKGAHSEAEFDPHAFLYWPKTGSLVVPLSDVKSGNPDRGTGALVLRITDGAITETGFVQHPRSDTPYPSTIRRSLMIDGTLWTVSTGGLMASDPGSAAQRAWLPFA